MNARIDTPIEVAPAKAIDALRLAPPDSNYAALAPRLLAQGFEPIPVTGKVCQVEGWENMDLTADQVTEWATNGKGNLNVGIRTGYLAAVDIDFYNAEVSALVAEKFQERFGKAPMRIGDAPKCLLLYRAETPGPKITGDTFICPDHFEHRVEVLGVGQQFVAYGIHPDTLRPYQWPHESLIDLELWELPVINRDEVAAWVRTDLMRLVLPYRFRFKMDSPAPPHPGTAAPITPAVAAEPVPVVPVAPVQPTPVTDTKPQPDLASLTSQSRKVLGAGWKDIPEELATLPGWLLWKWDKNEKGKLIKVPTYAPTLKNRAGRQGSEQDRADLRTLADVIPVLSKYSRYAGVGLALLPEWQITALDFDKVVGPDGKAAAWVEELIPLTYSEISPSGTGIRAFYRGLMPPALCDKKDNQGDGFGTFCNKGFVTVTGNEYGLFSALGGPLPRVPESVIQLAEKRFSSSRASAGPSHNFDPDDPFDSIKQPHDDVDIADLKWMLDHLAENYCDEYESWRNVIFAVHHQFSGTEQSLEALEILDEWSSKSAKYDSNAVAKIWDSASEQRNGLLTIGSVKNWLGDSWKEYRAQRKAAGALAKAKGEVQGATAEEVIDALRKLPTGSVASAWVELAVHLPPVQLDQVFQEVARLTGARVMPLKETMRQYKAEQQRQLKIAKLHEQARGRPIIPYNPMSSTLHARHVESLILSHLAVNNRQHEYVVFSGQVCAMVEDRLPHAHGVDDDDPESAPLVPTLRALDRAAFLARAEEVIGFTREVDGMDKPTEVPPAVLMQLESGAHEAPVVSGLVVHPVVRLNGEILGERGVHPSGLVVAGVPVPGCRPFTQHEAREAIQRLEASFCAGFEFDTPLDKAAALAALLTGVQRKVLDSAPGVLVLAASQNTGKTTLARRLHVILTGRDLPVVTFPPDADEVRKTLLALLLRSPALICFDNIPDGLNFRDASLAAVMTSASWEQRILGASEYVQVQTNTLFMVTGNNLTLGRDEITRMMVVRLVKPATGHRVFKHTDVVGHALEIRADVIRDVVGIVSGYLKSGTRIAATTRFQQWDRCVRQPLLWAAEGLGPQEECDVALIFEKNEAGSEEANWASHAFHILHKQFGSERFSARDVVNLVTGVRYGDPATVFDEDPDGVQRLDQEGRDTLCDAFAAMHCKDPGSIRSMSRVLSGYKGRSVSHPEQGGAFLRLRETHEGKRVGATYVVEQIDRGA